MHKQIDAGDLNVAYSEYGNAAGPCVLLLHGFPYDVRAFDDVVPILEQATCRILVPYLRGFGPTQMRSADTLRSGQQAALGYDILSFQDALGIKKAVLAGFDWGATGACVTAALWPERVSGLVATSGYKIQNIAAALKPDSPQAEHRYWYQYYFHNDRGRAGLQASRHEFCRLLWQLWSPSWKFSDATYSESANAFNNPDFVDIVIHSYRHRYGLVAGDPRFEALEEQLALTPKITVPSVALDGDFDSVTPAGMMTHLDGLFTNGFKRITIENAGHNIPQEAPAEFAAAILGLIH